MVFAEDDPRAVVIVGPGVEQHRRMKDVVYAVDGNRGILTRKVEDAFHAQKVLAT